MPMIGNDPHSFSKGHAVVKSDDRREALLEKLADHVLAEGLSASSLRPLARAAGISDRMLLYYFKDKAEVIAAVLERIALRLVKMLDAHRAPAPLPMEALRQALLATVFDEALWPYMRIWLEVASLAARGDPLYRDIGAQIGRGFLAWGMTQLDSPAPQVRATDAARLMVAIEGALVLRSLGLHDVVATAFRDD
jgi:AcrR family transcriptional regulator